MKYKGLFYLNIVLSVGVIAKDTKIIGGSDADAREFPYTVSMRDITENTIYCSGAIISHRHILTSAQCTTLYGGNPAHARIYTVITPSTSRNGQSYKIGRIFVHPDFNGQMNPLSMNINDISVIKVVETIEFNEFQNKIDLPTENIQVGVNCILSGWGSLTHPEDTVPTHLQKTVMTILSHRVCTREASFRIHPGQTCGFQRFGVGTSDGDSGSPLVHNNKVVGISSFNVPGARGYPDFFSNVYFYLDFINDVMEF